MKTARQRGQKWMEIIVQGSSRTTTRLITSELNIAVHRRPPQSYLWDAVSNGLQREKIANAGKSPGLRQIKISFESFR